MAYYNTNACCHESKNIKVIHRQFTQSLEGFPVVLQIEKCNVCGTEHGYKITENNKIEIDVDFIKGFIPSKHR